LQLIEYVQDLTDTDGKIIDPASIGMTSDFPLGIRIVVTFKELEDGKTETTLTEYQMPSAESQMGRSAEIGLNQFMDKKFHIFQH
jgi:hypothetical protein